MPVISIRRSGGWGDRFRAYQVWVDGQRHGDIRANGAVEVDLPPGEHTVELRIDAYGSGKVPVVLEEGGVALECGPNRHPLLAVFALFRPRQWIYLRVAGV